jgi:hypothetical protein
MGVFATLKKRAAKRAISAVDRHCRATVDADVSTRRVVSRVSSILEPIDKFEWVEEALTDANANPTGECSLRMSDDEVVRQLGATHRRTHGIYMTPMAIARGLASGVGVGGGEQVVDLAAGTGRMLVAAIGEAPGCRVTGVERSALLAAVAAVRVAYARLATGSWESGRDTIRLGDGLASEVTEPADVVLMNPPYGGEKGRREQFEAIRSAHPSLASRSGPRYDLSYFFIHRAIDALRPTGRLGLLSTEYWLYATGASPLRAHLWADLGPVWMVRAGRERLFEDAPGQHSLVARFDGQADDTVTAWQVTGDVDWEATLGSLNEVEAEAVDEPNVMVERGEMTGGSSPWRPFVTELDRAWASRLEEVRGSLEEFADDRQGFVSGADRVSSHRIGQVREATGEAPGDLERGDPGFVWERSEVTERLRRLRPTVLRPLVRGSALAPNDVILEAPDETYVLYIDGEMSDEQVSRVMEHLASLRPALEQRREVQKGRMPWYRLHWPRNRAEQVGPKLVVPRREKQPTFALDLSASAVSSDCTYLTAPSWVQRPVDHLIRLMHILNGPVITRYLEVAGKSKGELLEFYAAPLRRLPMPLRRKDGGTVWDDKRGMFDGERIQSRVAQTRDRLGMAARGE